METKSNSNMQDNFLLTYVKMNLFFESNLRKCTVTADFLFYNTIYAGIVSQYSLL